jgi:hypothetical protein
MPNWGFLWQITYMSKSLAFSRHFVGYHVSMFLVMCRFKGMCLMISSSYDICILFIFGPLFYNTMFLSWLATSYSCPSFMVLVWSYHWWSRYPFALVPLREWRYNSPWHTLKYCHNYYFGELNTCSKGGLPLFSLATLDND